MDPISDGSIAVTVAVYAALTYDIISATNSSPQTTEINASTRAATLMKWVRIGLAQAALFGLLGVMLDKRRWPPALGAGLAGVLLWVQYVHARNAGLANPGPSTEPSTVPFTGQDQPVTGYPDSAGTTPTAWGRATGSPTGALRTWGNG